MGLESGFCLSKDFYTSADFSGALHALAGDGVTGSGAQFAMSVNGLTVTASSGYALAAGRWLKNDDPLPLPLGPSGNHDDRTDAVVIRVDYEQRRASLEVLEGVNEAAIRADPAILRTDTEYCLFLYFIRVKRGVTTLTPEDVSDLRTDPRLCGLLTPLSAIAADVLSIYRFLTSGIDEEVARLVGKANGILARGDAAITELDRAVRHAGGSPTVGDLMYTRHAPEPVSEWLLCGGSPVPAAFPALSALTGGTLPALSRETDRWRHYIYGGKPQEG